MDIRHEILAALHRTGKTRADLVRSTGICRDSVYRYLSGKVEINARQAGQLLDAAGVRPRQPRWGKGRG